MYFNLVLKWNEKILIIWFIITMLGPRIVELSVEARSTNPDEFCQNSYSNYFEVYIYSIEWFNMI